MSETIPFDHENIKNYLDDCIRHLRERMIVAARGRTRFMEVSEAFMIALYIEAYEKVRKDIFGSPTSENET